MADSKKVFKSEYWSKAEAFVLPLTGLKKEPSMKAFMFWNEYSLENYQLVVQFEYDVREEFDEHCKRYVFPTLDKGGYLVEAYSPEEGKTIFVLDMSEWAMNIEFILAGKYSKLTKEAKNLIMLYHANARPCGTPPIYVSGVLYPHEAVVFLDGMTPMEYMAEEFGLDYDSLHKSGEIGSTYDRAAETLVTSVDESCQLGILQKVD